jgi:ribosome-binding factor A
MANPTRMHRVEDLLHRVLAKALQREIKDPRAAMATISAIKVAKDLSFAKVYVSFLKDPADIEEAIQVLNRAKGFLRHHIAKECELRIVPELQFVHDITIVHGQHMSSLIDKALAKSAPSHDIRHHTD